MREGRDYFSRHWAALAVACLAAPAELGCAHRGLTDQTLPVRQVAIYRNGVAYIARSGRVTSNEVRFRVKEADVGDFFATVAVAERGGSTVRAAAVPTEHRGRDQDWEEVQTVAISLSGGVGATHDLEIGYIAQSPVWKPSYRLVMRQDGTSEFQVWGLVQNESGEDWRDVRLSLIAGAPIAFSSQMQAPVVPTRPALVDHGESIGAIPPSETTFAHEEQPAAGMQLDSAGAVVSATGGVSASPKFAAARSGIRAAPAAGAHQALAQRPTPKPSEPPKPAETIETVSPEYVGGTTRYDLALPVTIPNESTSMVLVVSRPVRGEEVFLFAPNAGIPSSAEHPFRAIRFMNDTGGELEPGSLAIFEKGIFVGQALLEPVPIGASATLPFALDRAMSVEADRKPEPASIGEGHVAKIADGKLLVQVDRSLRTVYSVRNESDDAAKVLVKHRLGAGAKLFSPPAGTDERKGTALVPATVGPHAMTELVVEERSGEPTIADWFSDPAGYAVRAYLDGPKSDRDAVHKLGAAWSTREAVVDKMRERDHLRQQSYDLKQETEEIRRNLKAAGGGSADALRAKLGNHLAQVLGQITDDDKKIVALDAEIGDLSDRFKQAVRDIRIDP
jgi:hypothetical protein